MSAISSSIVIKQKTLSLGFSACGIAPARKLVEEEQRLKDYLDNQYNGEMGYLANHFDKRLDPTLLVPGAKSVIVVLMNYYPHQLQKGTDTPTVSKYAYGKDYHIVVKERLQQLYSFINQEIYPIQGRVFTDSAPVLERAWAVQAGLGWIGKNGLLINKELGSFFFIGELIIDLELEYDLPYLKEHCGSCNMCLNICPTKALVKPYLLDARRCISYLTIELKEDTPKEFKPLLNNRIFGCDSCQDVCPWNRNPKHHIIDEFYPKSNLLEMKSDDWHNFTEEEFNEYFGQSAINRTGYSKLKQNLRNLLSL